MATQKKGKGIGFGLGAVLLAIPIVSFFEGTVLTTYVDPVGIPTVCMGETDATIVMRKKFTEAECTALLGASLQRHMMEVAECVKVPVQPHEAAAIVSWSYNIGPTAACNSTLMAKLNAGDIPDVWCRELRKWTFAKGKQLPGLIKRRESEYKMCMTGSWK